MAVNYKDISELTEETNLAGTEKIVISSTKFALFSKLRDWIINSLINSNNSADVFSLITFKKSLQLTTAWQDVGIGYQDLSSGTYVISCYTGYNYQVGGASYQETYVGIIQWFSSSTNSTTSDEIILHRSGHAPNSGILYLRTIRSASSSGTHLKLQAAYSINTTNVFDYVFKFRRLI